MRRRTERILAPIRIRVIGNDASGVSFAEETVTVSFNQQGARISLTHSLLPDDVVLVKNLENSVEEEFRVVGAFQQVFGNRREWGVEGINPESGIWGIGFAASEDGAQPRVLIECAACKAAAQSIVSSIEYEVLLATGLISRHCERCNETPRWKPSTKAIIPKVLGQAKKTDPKSTHAVPRMHRLKLTMQLRVRNAWGVVDIAQTRDVSKSALCFVSSQRFSLADTIYITLPYAKNQHPVEMPGNIRWTAETAAGRFYGVEYLH